MSKLQSNIFVASFTDAYGVAHPAAQCFVTNISQSSNASFAAPGESSLQSGSVNYQVRYWHSPETKDAGARNQEFIDKNGMANFNFAPADDLVAGGLVQACVDHFVSKVLIVA